MRVLFILIFFIFANNSNAYSEGMVTWGTTGSNCKSFNSNLVKYNGSDDFEEIVMAEIRAFLTGYNMYIGIRDGTSDNMKIINQDSSEFIFSYVKNYCKKKKDSAVFMGLVEYFNELK